jgi:hypothetical protein
MPLAAEYLDFLVPGTPVPYLILLTAIDYITWNKPRRRR